MSLLETKIISTSDKDVGRRLDKFLSDHLPEFSRSRLQALISQNMVTLAGQVITDANHKVKSSEAYILTIPEPTPTHIIAQEIALDIIYEDDDLLVINKQAGLTVHPAPGHPDQTLVNALLAHCGDSLSGIGGVLRPGIVHRLDKDTTGLMVAAKHDEAHHHLSAQLADRSLSRTYQAVCWNTPLPASGTITGNIGRSLSNRQKMAIRKTGGKPAATHYQTLEHYKIAALMECKLETGRTHQIRVHMAYLGHPLIGDPLYGQPTSTRLHAGQYKKIRKETRELLLAFPRQALHAIRIGFVHPRTNTRMEFSTSLPEDMQQLIAALQQAVEI